MFFEFLFFLLTFRVNSIRILFIKNFKIRLNKIGFFAYFDKKLKFLLSLFEFNFHKSSNFKKVNIVTIRKYVFIKIFKSYLS